MRTAVKGILLVSALSALVGCGTGATTPAAGSSTTGSSAAVETSDVTKAPARPPRFDVCHVLTDDQLTTFGQPLPGTRTDADGDPVCQFEGKPFTIGFQYAIDKPVDSFSDKPMMFSEYARKDINGRAGAHFLVTVPNNCSYVLDIGDNSSLWLWVFAEDGQVNACAKAEEVARVVEPTLPRA